MADTKISALDGATTPLAGTEVLPIVQGGSTVNVSVANLTAGRAISATELTLTTGNLIVANGQGIDFSATPGTGTSELLADYEEGTWSPSIASTVGALTIVDNGTGYYTKIGRAVSITCRLGILVNGTGSVALIISGLPFASSPAENIGGAGREPGVGGNAFCFSAASSTSLYTTKVDNTYPGGNGYYFPINFTYFTS